MSIHGSDSALDHFNQFKGLLGDCTSLEMVDCISVATDEARLQFTNAVLDLILRQTDYLSDEIVIGALYAIVDPCVSMLPYGVVSNSVPAGLRTEVLEQFFSVFDRIFHKKCEPGSAEVWKASCNPWNLLCFMWWEVLPRHGHLVISSSSTIDIEFLQILGRILEIDYPACQQAALHGLSHWQPSYPEIVKELIVRHAKKIPDELTDYARAAQFGSLQ